MSQTSEFSELHKKVLEILSIDSTGCYIAILDGFIFSSAFQPIFDRNMDVYGVEGLIRITDNEGTLVDLNQYFRTIENDKAKSLLSTTLCTMVHIRNFALSKYKDTKIFINTSPVVFENLSNCDDALHLFSETLNRIGVKINQVIFEIMELEGVDLNATLVGMDKLRKEGMLIAMDDYGSESSTDERAMLITPDFMKIDKSIIDELSLGLELKFKEVMALGAELNAKTVAEGIESEESLKACLDLGADFFQGYYLGKPEKSTSTS